MPSRRQYAGGGTAQTLTVPLTSVALTATLSDNSGWPDGSIGGFSVVVDRGLGTEEKMLVATQAANTLTIQTRGYDGTGAQAHASGATVELCVTAIDLDEANAHTSATRGVHGITGQVVGDTDSQALSNKILVSPIQTDFTNATHGHTSAATGGLLTGNPVVKVHNSGPVTLANGVFVPLSWDTADVDTNTMHAAGAPTRLTSSVAGWYLVTANVELTANATGARFIRLLIDGTTVAGAVGGGPVLGGANFNASLTELVFLDVTHYVEVQAYQASGSSLNTSSVNGSNDFSALWVHA